MPFPYFTATVFLRSSAVPFSQIIHNEVENAGETGELSFSLNPLAMMMSLATKFEGLQASFPISLVMDSGFSGEDLVSDLLGFYRVVSIQNPFDMLRPVSKDEALKRWDYYGKIGNWKNEGFTPLLFPDPEKFPNSRPYKAQLPNFMQSVKPWTDFRSGIVAVSSENGSYMDKAKGGFLPYA